MREYLKFYIDGQWVDPIELKTLDVDNPTTEQVGGKIAIGSEADVDKAVKAARKAFNTWHSRRAKSASRYWKRCWPNTRSAPVTWATRCTRRWAHRPRWHRAPR